MNNWKKLLFIIITIILIFTIIKFIFDSNKTIKNGNNKNIKEIEQTILNINSYRANIDVTIKSNKNENYYKLQQEVNNEYAKQIVQEPENIKGMQITYQNGKLEIQNTTLNISKIYENYPYINNNILFLTDFISEYKKDEGSKIEEIDNEVIMKCNNTNKNKKYTQSQNLYIDKKTLKPTKIEIIDINQNIRVYILYNEIEFNI